MSLSYPLQLSFRILSLAPQIYVRDAAGKDLLYVRQKFMRMKESVQVYSQEGQQEPIFNIDADRIIDFSANYRFTDGEGHDLGAVRRKGMSSLWRARYEISDSEQVVMLLRENKPFTKFADGIFGQIPVIGLLSGYVF